MNHTRFVLINSWKQLKQMVNYVGYYLIQSAVFRIISITNFKELHKKSREKRLQMIKSFILAIISWIYILYKIPVFN